MIFVYQRFFRESRKVLRSFNIKVVHKPIRSIFNILLKSQKTRLRKELPEESCIRSNLMIVIVFITFGQTSGALKTRVKEHTKVIAILDKKFLLAKHRMLHNPQIDLESVKIVDRSSAWRQRLFIEAWYSMRNIVTANAINEHIALPNIYNNII